MRLALLLSLLGAAISLSLSITSPSGGPTAFSLPNGDVLHFVAPKVGTPAAGWAVGSDSNSGLDKLHPWGSIAHTMNCGDVIIAAPGNYANDEFSDVAGAVNSCPSTTGGIDGTGGIWFAVVVCGGADLMSCQVSGDGGVSNPNAFFEFTNGMHNWAAEGFYMDGGTTQQNNGFGYRSCDSSLGPVSKLHHLAFINSIGYRLGQMVASNDCGHNNGSAEGGDYIASIGLLAVNSNEFGNFGGLSSGAIAPGALVNWDTIPGTHIYSYNNYGPSNVVRGQDGGIDGEFIYYDSFDVHGFSQLVATVNNLGYLTERWQYAVTDQGSNAAATATFKAYNNSFLNGWTFASAGSPGGNIDFTNNGCCPPITTHATHVVQRNVSVVTYSNGIAPGGATVYALNLQGHYGTLTFGGAGNENVLISTVPSCTAGACSPNFAATDQSGDPYPNGVNLYPPHGTQIFANVADLANRTGAPNCTGFVNTTACMGYNANTQVLTPNTFISDMQCVYSQCAGKGFQLPSTTCVTPGTGIVADFPVWLKGIVYLHWNGTSVEQRHDLVTTPCGL